jgi:hypothetical protein
MSLTQQFHLIKRICFAVDACCDGPSPTVHARATAAALQRGLRTATKALLEKRIKGCIFSFEALYLFLDAAVGVQLLMQRCCHSERGLEAASTAHVFIKLAPCLYSRMVAAATMMHVTIPEWDEHVESSDFADQLSDIKACAAAAADNGSMLPSELFLDLIVRLQSEPRNLSAIVPAELLKINTVSLFRSQSFIATTYSSQSFIATTNSSFNYIIS